MISHFDRHVGRRFARSNRPDPRFFRGHQRPGFFYGHPGHHRSGGHWQQPTAEQLALRSTVAEVARLFVIAARTSQGSAEQQGRLRAFLERDPAKSFPISSTEPASNLSIRILRINPK